MIYPLLRYILFKLPPEKAHALALKSLQWARFLGMKHIFPSINHPRQLMGLHFKNPIGLAAGLDKNGDYIDALSLLGFGFIEIGTVTPKPQKGNPPPRLFRLAKEEALINRMGFNSKGIDYVIAKLEKTHYKGILGINIGKNKTTPLDHAIDDYLVGFRALAPFASYMTINISSPNTEGLRTLQENDFLLPLLTALKQAQKKLYEKEKKYVPLVVKISPDLTINELENIAHIILKKEIDGVIATNTTISRPVQDRLKEEQGGLSGRPLFSLSTHILSELYSLIGNKIPIMASGGIMDAAMAKTKLENGASLLQLYTGFIYQGPRLIRECAEL